MKIERLFFCGALLGLVALGCNQALPGEEPGETDTSSETSGTVSGTEDSESGSGSESESQTQPGTSGTGQETGATDTGTAGTVTESGTGNTETTETNTESHTSGTGSETSATATESESDTETQTSSLCSPKQHLACYGDEIWCHTPDGRPVSQVEVCEGGKKCAIQRKTPQCECRTADHQGCYNDDVWGYDSCGNFEGLVEDCNEEYSCAVLGDGKADCCDEQGERICGVDGNIHLSDSCFRDLGIVEQCVGNAACVEDERGMATCECRNHWEGKNCEICPNHYDADADCNGCRDYWSGEDCGKCEGYGDNCQCPDNTFSPEPNSRRCWTCYQPNGNPGGGRINGYCGSLDIVGCMTFEKARKSCPPGFRLPVLNELMGLYWGCTFNDWNYNYYCKGCNESRKCSEVGIYSEQPAWVNESCGEDRVYVFNTAGGYTKCVSAINTVAYLVCVNE